VLTHHPSAPHGILFCEVFLLLLVAVMANRAHSIIMASSSKDGVFMLYIQDVPSHDLKPLTPRLCNFCRSELWPMQRQIAMKTSG